MLAPASHCADSHHADGLTSCSSADSHRADRVSPDTMAALLSYNVGIQNAEITGKKWTKKDGKYNLLKNDVQKTFEHDTGIQILLISEFGNMFDTISNAAEIFTTLLAELDLTHIHFEAMPPYVALIDKNCWQVKKSERMTKLCDHRGICVHHLVVQCVGSGALLQIFNGHIPTSVATRKRKETCVLKMCDTATSTFGSGVAQPTAVIPWVIVGDLNVDAGTLMKWCQPFLEKHVSCMSTSGWPQTRDAQKADIAISQGIALIQVKSWIGWHSPPCASDTHDAVVVMGVLNQEQTVHEVNKERSSSSWAIPGDTHSVANFATPKATADVIESGQGESNPLSEKDAPKFMTTPASQYVGDESSGDAHPVASETSIDPKVEECIQEIVEIAQADNACASDTHDAVVVMGALNQEQTVHDVNKERYVGNESSGDAHPVASETSIEQKVEECIQEIVEIAQADNGALLGGDLPHATRYEAPEVRMAAQDLLATLYSCMDGYAIRTEQEVLQAMTTPIRRRQEYTKALAASRGVSQPAGGRCDYTQNEWLDWYAEMPLSEADMDAAVSQWKKDFPMNPHSLEKIEAWEEEGTRSSKQQARNLRNGAFAAYLQQECIAKQLAMSFLKFPSATVHTLLQHWGEYTRSPEHAKEKARALRLDPGNVEAVREKERQIEVKKKLHSLRHQKRQVIALHAKKCYSEMSWQQQQQYKKWRSGKMDQELQELTLEHGYGLLPLDKGILLPTRFPDTAALKK
jgi:hypothetical protein